MPNSGANIWRSRRWKKTAEKKADTEQDEVDAAEQQEHEADDKPAWTAEGVAAAIEGMIRQNAHLIRRARWFCLLSESVLVWSPAPGSKKIHNRIIFESGSIVNRGEVKNSRVALVPPGYAKSFRQRQNNIDLMTYDRLRVVTTELRRILADGRYIELGLRPNVVLGREDLSRALKWV